MWLIKFKCYLIDDVEASGGCDPFLNWENLKNTENQVFEPRKKKLESILWIHIIYLEHAWRIRSG